MPEHVSDQVWKLSEYGVAGIVLAVVLVCAIALVWWMLRQFEKNQERLEMSQERLDAAHERMNNERAKWFEVTIAFKAAIEVHSANALENYKRIDEANKYVREEHKEMCAALAGQNQSMQMLIQELKLRPCVAETR
ncbi:MAG: hypothetical protein LLG04_09255 [Parachlamydia sp.]|nr:hypothetical protein [Parachlamydia sp.]